MDGMPPGERGHTLRVAHNRRLDALLMISQEASEIAFWLSMQPDGRRADYEALDKAWRELHEAEGVIRFLMAPAAQPPMPDPRPEPTTPEMAAWVAGVAGTGFGA